MAVHLAQGLVRGLVGRAAIRDLQAAGFRIFVLEHGTICAYKNDHAYGFAPRRPEGLYNEQAIKTAIEVER